MIQSRCGPEMQSPRNGCGLHQRSLLSYRRPWATWDPIKGFHWTRPDTRGGVSGKLVASRS